MGMHCKRCYTPFSDDWKASGKPVIKSRIAPVGKSPIKECPKCGCEVLIYLPKKAVQP